MPWDDAVLEDAAPNQDGDTATNDGRDGDEANGDDADVGCLDHCRNGILDCGEEAIDCGGDCFGCLLKRGKWLGVLGRDGRWRVAVPTGEGDLDSADVLQRMARNGRNLALLDTGAKGCAFYTNDSGVCDFHREGLNEDKVAQIDAMLSLADTATPDTVGVALLLWDTTELEEPTTDDRASGGWLRWEENPWNRAVNPSSPYDTGDRCGKRDFMSRPADYVEYAPGSAFPASASTQAQGLWLQEKILHRIATLAAAHHNASIFLLWEAADGSSNDPLGDCDVSDEQIVIWHRHLAAYVRGISPATLVTTGVDWSSLRSAGWYATAGLDYASDEVGGTPGCAFYRVGEYCSEWPAGHADPVVSVGYDFCDLLANYTNTAREILCVDDAYMSSFPFGERIRAGWPCGVQLGAPFWEYSRNSACYPPTYLDPYFNNLRAFLDGVTTWEDEPGHEIRAETVPR